MKRRWHDYDDGFDEADLHEDGEFEFSTIEGRAAVKMRPKLRAVQRRTKKHNKYEDETERRRMARVKAWDLPH